MMSDNYERKKCTYAAKYKAIKKPTCGCEFCNKIWDEKQKEKKK